MRRTTIPAAAVVALALAGCGSSTKTGSGDGNRVQVKLTDAGCPAKLEQPAGPTTFEVTNDGADAVSEFEILDGGRVLGEVENLTPGLSGTFSLTLKPGTFTTACPGGKTTAEGDLIVTGGDTGVATTTPEQNAAGRQAVTTYREYVEEEAALLVTDTTAFVNAIKAGNLEGAKHLFPTTRTHYETIEPIAESFGDLDPEIDARVNDVPAKDFKGFHRIEQQMWENGNLDGLLPVADELLANVTQLQRRIPAIELEPAQIANGSVELLNEVVSSKITGEEDRYSHTDLWDFAANLEGAQQSYEALEPIVTDQDPELAAKVEARFTSTEDALETYRQGDGYVLYTDLTKADTRKLAARVDALADVLSKLAPLVVQN